MTAKFLALGLLLVACGRPSEMRTTHQLSGSELEYDYSAWETYRSENFIVEAPDLDLAKRAADSAEDQREVFALHWFDRDLADWSSPATLRVHMGSNWGESGSTSWTRKNSDQAYNFQMNVFGPDWTSIANNIITHEVSHSVWASAYTFNLPRWLDEGLAVLTESESSRILMLEPIMNHANADRIYPIDILFEMDEYPSRHSDTLLFYAQATSLVVFLLETHGGKEKLLEFVESSSLDQDWKQGLQRVYGISVAELEQQWLEQLQHEASL